MGSYEEGYRGFSNIIVPDKEVNEKTEEATTGLFEDVGSYLIVFTHSCFEKITYLPFPIGTIIEAVEELVDPWTRPSVEAVEGFSLRLLAAVDDQIYFVGTSAEGCILCTSRKLKLVLSSLRKRGLIGVSADLWVLHEASLREKAQAIIDIANRIPLLNLITPLLCAILVPLAKTISDWLVEHSQSEGESIQDFPGGKEHSGGEEVKAVDRPTEIQHPRDVKEEDEIKAIDSPTHSQVKDVPGGRMAEAKEGVQEHKKVDKVNKAIHDDKENDATDVSHVLEMIDSGWLMGSVAASPKTTPSSTKVFSSPKKPANPKSRKGILRHE